MFSNLYKYLFLSVSLAFIFQPSFNQEVVKTDSLLVKSDTLRKDSIQKDTTLHKRVQVSDFKSKLTYTASDSTSYSADLKKAYLYGNAKVNYEDIELTANYIEYDFTNNMVFAKGLPDSTGTIKGEPEFKQGSESFNAQTLTYNFKTKKGIIYKISTKQGDGFLLANKTKREANGIINLKGGKYTTCDLPDPHFYLALTKAVVVPGDKIVSGPAYFVLEDVPIFPVFIPFGFFPNKKKNTSGILMPTYGQEASRGYFLTDGGYYFAINDYFDFTVKGDIYSRGGWGAGLQTRYKKIYKYSGNINIRYNLDKTGEKGLDLKKTNNYSITWNHTQDPKANPSRQFSANVDFKTSSYDQRFNYNDPTKVINNTTSSGISYRKTWTNFALSLTARASQTTSSKTVDMTLPSMSFTTTQGFYPFKKKSSAGVPKWYENIKFTYSAESQNRMVSSQDEMFTKPVLRRAQNGFHHSVPLSTSIKFLRFFNFSPNIRYEGMFYGSYIRKEMRDSIDFAKGKKVYYVTKDTV